jgi:1-acyl-sn-glycerol-3-phosphate acyltransferase
MTAGTIALIAAGAAIVAATLYAAAAWIRRGPEDRLPMALLRLLNDIFMTLYHGLRKTPARPVPLEGPAIIVSNHRSGLDPLVIAASTKRIVRFLMAREYYEMKGLAWVFRTARCIPVNRNGNDLGATKAALTALRDGEVVGIFPEGGIRTVAAGERIAGKAGAALLALKSGAPVIPAGIRGTPNLDSVLLGLIRPSRSRVAFGEPFRLEGGGKPGREEVEEASRRILEKVEELTRG